MAARPQPPMFRSSVAVALVLSMLPLADSAFATVVSAVNAGSTSSSSFAYEEFRKLYGRTSREKTDSVGYHTRQQLFEARRKKVEMHNELGRSSWVAKVNKFADYTEEELNALRGYRRVGGRWSRSDSGSASGKGASHSSFLEMRRHQNDNDNDNVDLAESVDWRHSASQSQGYMREQGACGSCWAVAAVGALEMHAELRGHRSVPLSYEQLVDCVPNPRHCGGTGGCKGATAELAFQYVREHGIVAADAYSEGYQHGGSGVCQPTAHTTATMVNFETLELNKLQPMLETLALKGPAVASVDATDWASYSSGVFNSCERNATVNHAVLVVGYGVDRTLGKDYWLIRNSWGDQWGENGYIRLERHASDEGEAGHCGVDHDPKQGVGCDGGPAAIKVCGMCGVLSDTCYPKEVSMNQQAKSSPMERIYSKVNAANDGDLDFSASSDSTES